MRYLCLVASMIVAMSCSPSPQATKPTGCLTMTIDSVQTRFDTIRMGIANEGEVLMGMFAIKNDKDRPIVITNVVTGCGCTMVNYDKAPIKPDEERLINFTFDTRGRQGKQFKSIDVVTADHHMSRIFIDLDILKSQN